MSRTYKDRYSHKQRTNKLKIKIRESNLISNKIINSKKQREHDNFSFKFVYFLLDKSLKEGKTYNEFVLEVDNLFKHMPMAYKVKAKNVYITFYFLII